MQVEINRSSKRVKTVSARLVGEVVQITAPAGILDADLEPIVESLLSRIQKRQAKKDLVDSRLQEIAQKLNQKYFKGSLQWTQITWSTHQQKRYGSCTPSQRTIRISSRLATLPNFVLEYVVMHELAHLLEANHGHRFWRLVNQYPKSEQARGYLMALGMDDSEQNDPEAGDPEIEIS